MKRRVLSFAVYIFSICFLFCMCATARQKNGAYDVLKYSSGTSEFQKYLVSIDSYTTNGSEYHKKYKKYLYGIAKIFITEKKNQISEKSIGFYFDKKENRKDRLYLGADLRVDDALIVQSGDYDKNSRSILRSLLGQSVNVISSCDEILRENEVKGIVLGFIWMRSQRQELINIWISKEDIELFLSEKLTLNEMVLRSTVTNTEGRIFRLTL